MKRITVLFILSLLGIKGKSQLVDSTVLINFNNSNEWSEWSNESSVSKINSGFLESSHLRTTGSWPYVENFKFDESEYEMEAKIQFVSGAEDQGFGVLFGFKDWDNYNTFIITKNGYYSISSENKNKYDDLVPWKKDKAIKSSEANILKIIKKDKTITFYLNDSELYSTKASKMPLFGTYNGMIIYNKIKIKTDYFKVKAKFAKINLVPDAIKGYKKENLGTNVNSQYTEVNPVISADGKTLFINRKDHPENTGGAKDDVWYCTLNADGSWSKAKNFGKPVNNDGHNAVNAITADNTKLYLINTYNSDGTPKSSGLSVSAFEKGGWAIPKDITITNFYNDHQYVNFNLSQDSKYLMQAIQRKDSRGDSDIYVSILNSDGTYAEPINLGDAVNTSDAETTPFLAADNVTLYFSSNGHPGYGSNDIFVTKRLDDTWTKWSPPLNLGPEVNSKLWEAYFTIPASGNEAYMTQSETSSDIVRIKLSESAKPNPVALISGKVYNKKTSELIGAKINYIDLSTNENVGVAESNPQNGEYTIILQYGKKYSIRAEKEGFYAINDFLDLTEISSYQEVKKDLYLVPVEVGQVIRLNNIFFDLNKSDIKDESAEELNRLVEFMSQNKSVSIEIGGHTDDQGSDAYNATLSNQRAESVVNYLIGKGIEKTRLTYKGYGESKPVVKNDSDENRAFNRRVEFTIMKQ
jgi:outer membrane protein OmpA-like peptidoglycan-associated protein